jgi:hypothetical protein
MNGVRTHNFNGELTISETKRIQMVLRYNLFY